jgi:hypothetical protein
MTKPINTNRAAKAQGEPIPGTVIAPNPDPLGVLSDLHVYSTENLEARQQAFEDSGAAAFVIKDEWHGRIQESNPFEEVAAPYVKANPHLHFRFISEAHSKRRTTRGYVPVKDKDTGAEVIVGRQKLSYIPQEVHEIRKSAIEQRTAEMRRAAEENMTEQMAKFERESKGAIKTVSKDKIVAGIPVGAHTTRGSNIF